MTRNYKQNIQKSRKDCIFGNNNSKLTVNEGPNPVPRFPYPQKPRKKHRDSRERERGRVMLIFRERNTRVKDEECTEGGYIEKIIDFENLKKKLPFFIYLIFGLISRLGEEGGVVVFIRANRTLVVQGVQKSCILSLLSGAGEIGGAQGWLHHDFIDSSNWGLVGFFFGLGLIWLNLSMLKHYFPYF